MDGSGKEAENTNNNKPTITTDSKPELLYDFSNLDFNCPTITIDANPELINDFSNLDLNLKYNGEEQLEGQVLDKLEMIYNEALKRLQGYGYGSEVARKGILMNGHGFGNRDILTNVVHNSVAYIKSGLISRPGNDVSLVFEDMRQLVKYSLALMVHLLQRLRPEFIKCDALWCLLMSEFHVGLARTFKLPTRNEIKNDNSVDLGNKGGSSSEKKNVGLVKRFNLTPRLIHELKKNVMHIVAGYQTVVPPEESKDLGNSLVCDKLVCKDQELSNSDLVDTILRSLGDMSLDEKSESESVNEKNKTISLLINEIKCVEEQLKETKEWAHKKVVQAAKKLTYDLIELRELRRERDENQWPKKKVNWALGDETEKRLSEMENALSKASREVNLTSSAVRKLEIENLEMKAELEAFKLSTSESDRICLEIAKKERKCLKRLLALEKQNNKFREEIEGEKNKFLQLQQHLLHLKKAQEETEVKSGEEVKAKELAIAQVQEELRLKKEADVSFKRKQEALHQKMELDCQRCKDDMNRLEEEISRLQMSLDSTDSHHLPDVLFEGEFETTKSQRDTTEVMLPESYIVEEDRACLICMENEASVVLLPCSHKVLCATCNKDFYENVKARCPCCMVQTVERIRVYGASS